MPEGLNVDRTRPDMTNMIPVTHGYARVSKSDRDDRNLDTQLRELANHGARDLRGAHLLRRDDWQYDVAVRLRRTRRAHGPGPSERHHLRGLVGPVQPKFRQGVRIQTDLTKRNIAIKEDIDTADDSAVAKLFCRMMMANGVYQADSTSERIKPARTVPRPKGGRLGVHLAHSRPGERVQAYVRGEPNC